MKAAIACPQGIKSAKVDPCCFREVSDKLVGYCPWTKTGLRIKPPKGIEVNSGAICTANIMYKIQSSQPQRRCGCGLGILSPSLTCMYEIHHQ